MSLITDLFKDTGTNKTQKPPAPVVTPVATPVAPTPSAPVPVPDVAAVAPAPKPNSADTLAAGVAAANTIAQRAGRSATVLTRQRATRGQTLAAGAGAPTSDYSAKTLG